MNGLIASDTVISPQRLTDRRTGFTIAEAVISMTIVAVMLTAALSTVSSARFSQYRTNQNSQGQFLAQDLLTEILCQAYSEPNSTGIGTDSKEGTATRSDFDDVDDYHNWNATPPQYKNGTTLAGATGWSRSVTVTWVDPVDPNMDKATESGVKRITVSATHQGIPMHRCYGLVSDIDLP